MKILGREIIIRRAKRELADPQKPKKTDVYQFPVMSQSQGFASYYNVKGRQQLSFDLIDGLYDKTVMNRIVNKVAGDCTRMNYSVSYIDMEGDRDEDIELIGMQVDVRLTRSVLRNIFRDMLKYGTAFLYVQYGQDGIPIQMYTIDPRYLTPVIEDGQLTGWEYMSSGKPIKLTTQELIFFPNDPATGEIFGKSMFGPVIQILELLLNSQLNNAILIDRYAIPIIQWALDSGIPESRTDIPTIEEFMKNLIEQLSVGNDVGTDSGVEARVVGTDSNLIDFIPIVQDQKETLGITCGVPLQLIGMRGDNLSVTTRQMQSYLEFVRDVQEMVADRLIEFLYKPFLEANGYIQLENYREIYIDFPVQAVEEQSKAITWIAPAVNLGLITRDQARNTLGFKGKAMEIDDIEIPGTQPEVIRPGARKDPEATPSEPSVTEPDESKRKHE